MTEKEQAKRIRMYVSVPKANANELFELKGKNLT